MNAETNIPADVIATEREYLRALMGEYAAQTADLEKYALTIAGAVWSWCIAHSDIDGIKYLFFLPAFTTLLFGMRALSVYRLHSGIRDYLKQLQIMAELPAGFGWESYIQRHGQLALRSRTAKAFWAVLQATSVVVGATAAIKLP